LRRARHVATTGSGNSRLTALPVSQLRTEADAIARALRELDVRLQQANWEVDLLN